MNYSKEIIYHFVCNDHGDGCDMWWSIATENFNPSLKTWTCSWCGQKHLPPHKDKTLKE